VIDNEYNHGTDNGNEHAVQIETGYSGTAAQLKQPTAHKRSDYAEDNVEEDTRPLAIYDLAGDKAGDQPENNPAND
jgi:hypothetical protein